MSLITFVSFEIYSLMRTADLISVARTAANLISVVRTAANLISVARTAANPIYVV